MHHLVQNAQACTVGVAIGKSIVERPLFDGRDWSPIAPHIVAPATAGPINYLMKLLEIVLITRLATPQVKVVVALIEISANPQELRLQLLYGGGECAAYGAAKVHGGRGSRVH